MSNILTFLLSLLLLHDTAFFSWNCFLWCLLQLKLVPRHYKFGVIFARGGQTTDDEYLNNSQGSEAFDKFMGAMAKKIELKGWPGYPGGLDVVHGQTGKYAYFTKFRDYDIMFHVSTCLPHVSGDDQQLEKKRHIGNDVVVIVFQDGDTPIAPSTIKSYFNHVFIIVHPIRPEETPKSDTPPAEHASPSPTRRERGGSTDSNHHERVPSDNSSLGAGDNHTDPDLIDDFGRLDLHDRNSLHPSSSSHRLHGGRVGSVGDGIPPHSPSSPTILQRLGPDRSGVSPSRSRSPIFVRHGNSPRSADGDSPAGSPPRSALDFSTAGQPRSSSAVLSGSSPSNRGLHSINERSSTPSRVPHLRYNVDSRTQSAIVGQHSYSVREGSRDSTPVPQNDSSPSYKSRDRRHNDDGDKSSAASSSGAMRSPRIHDGAAEEDDRSNPSDEEIIPAFIDPVSAAAMPSGGTLPPTWHLEHVAATPREGSLSSASIPRLHMDGRSSSIDSGQHSPTGLRIRSDSSFTDERRVSMGGAGSAAGFDSDTPRSFGHDSEDAHSFPLASALNAPISKGHSATVLSSSSTGTEDSILAPSVPAASIGDARSASGSGKLDDLSSKSGEELLKAAEAANVDDDGVISGRDRAPSDALVGDEEEGEDDKKRRLSRRMSLGSSKQLIKSSKSGKLVKAMPQITRAKMNVAAKNPPVQYRIEVVCKDGVIPCDPKLPTSPIFNAGPYLREFLLTKLINAERAAYYSKHFSKPIERTRELLLLDMVSQNK